MPEHLRTPQWWLATLDQYGNPSLIDGSHQTEAEAHHAFYLHQRLGFAKGRRYAVAKVELIEPVENPDGADEETLEAIAELLEIEDA